MDDEPLVLELFQTFFLSKGFSVFVASSPKQAITHIDKGHFDAIVCDVMMEGLDGFGILALARAKNPQVGFVLVTGAPAARDRARAEEFGATYLSKPIGVEALLEAVKFELGAKNETPRKRA